MTMTNTKTNVAVTKRKIGNVVYIIRSSSSETATKPLTKKIEDMIRKDAATEKN